MATTQGQVQEAVGGFVDKRRSPAASQVSSVTKSNGVISYTDRTALETYLLAHGYTQVNLDRRNMNDLVYAVRLSLDPTGI